LIGGLNDGISDVRQAAPGVFIVPTQPLGAVPVEPRLGMTSSWLAAPRSMATDRRSADQSEGRRRLAGKYTLPSLTYRGVRASCRSSLARESKDIPTLRKIGFFGLFGRLGAVCGAAGGRTRRCVAARTRRLSPVVPVPLVDTGIHAKRWSREKAADYMVATTGFARPRTRHEVERYCTQAGRGLQLESGTWHGRARVKLAHSAFGSTSSSSDILRKVRDAAHDPGTRRVDERVLRCERG
jgi:uncharacterized protein (DUF885 family)